VSNFIRSGKNNPCPVCDRTKDGDCSWYPDGQTVLCHTYRDGGSGWDDLIWKYLGVAERAEWGKFIRIQDNSQWQKPSRPKESKEFFYHDRDGNDLVRVTRIDDGSGGKSFYQSRWDGSKWVKGCPKEIRPKIPVYRYWEVREAIERGERVFICEGEGVADTLWSLGIAATTTIGGSGGYKTYGRYQQDLAGARLILCPDRDEKGIEYIANFERDFSSQIEGYYLAGSEGLWKKPQGGMDIADEIRDFNLSKEEILAKVIGSEKYREILTPSPSQPPVEEMDGGKPHFSTCWERGLEWESWEKNKETGEYQPTRTRIGNHVEAIAYCESPDGSGTAIQIEFRTQRNKAARVMIPRTTLTGDGTEAIKFLVDRGYHFVRKQKSLLLDYLFGLGGEIERVYTIADKSGWINGSFLTPAKTYGDENLRCRDSEPDMSFAQIKGTLDGWKSEVAAKCEGNSRLIFSLGCAFAAPLLEPVQIESGGFHLVGSTSIGKTTGLKVMSSVAGLKNIPSWRTTSNALEGKATEFNHLGMPIDEINQALAPEVGQAAYLLGNGKGKERMLKSLGNAKQKTWELLFVSTGELSMGEYLKQAKMPLKGGMEARMPSIPADAGKGYGIFEDIHGHKDSGEFLAALESSIRQYQGTVLDRYLTQLVEDRKSEGFDRELREKVYSIGRKKELGWLKVSTESDRNTVKRTILKKRRSFFAFQEFWVEAEEEKIPQINSDLDNGKKSRDARDTRGSNTETSSESQSDASRSPRDSKNSNGTHGTGTGQSSDSLSRCPVDENSTGQERDNLEPSPEDDLDSLIPCVPYVPLKKHGSQNPPEEISRYKVGDRVRYSGGSEIFVPLPLDRVGTIIDFDRAAGKYEVDWGEGYSGCSWFESKELEVVV
jgi:hypothetical protein